LEINEIEDVYEIVKPEFPSVIFGFEMAFLDLQRGGIRQYFDTSFSHVGGKIPINGLIWMGTKEQMKNQIDEKLAKGFKVLKLKIGAIDFLSECQLLESIRNSYPSGQLEIRVDANGAFSYTDALDKLSTLSEFQLHSIEQPIRAGQPELMKRICQKSLVPVALDEELIGVIDKKDKLELLKKIKPQYIILKPTLVGGIKATREWIDIAENLSIGWWITSALESNIGLNAIAQLTSTYFPLSMPQGLGTGQLYTNNIEAPISVSDGNYVYLPNETWGEIL
jgi:o-succinylbenzoate synthase